MTTAIIMAGGRSARMRASAGPRHKSLVPVLGVPMLERNLCALLSEGFRDLTVAISAQDTEIERYVLDRGRALARARRARLECLRETTPLGTIGAVSALKPTDGPVLVVNVDNLTALSLRKLVAFHEAEAAAMTIASHLEPVQVPCGELQLAETRVTAYLEKPLKRVTASSGTYVIGPRARDVMGAHCRWDVPALVNTLIARGETVSAMAHDAPWIDVNDAATVAKAERLIGEHMHAFELWQERPAAELVALLALAPSRASLVTEPFVPDDVTLADAVQRILANGLGWMEEKPEFLVSFDDLDVTTAQLVRHHVFVANVTDDAPSSRDATDAGEPSAPLRRALAYANRTR
jgi:NDP-sugar pyrophosphorylase family protein